MGLRLVGVEDEHKGSGAWIYDRNVVKLAQNQTDPILTLVSNTPEYKVLKVWKMATAHENVRERIKDKKTRLDGK